MLQQHSSSITALQTMCNLSRTCKALVLGKTRLACMIHQLSPQQRMLRHQGREEDRTVAPRRLQLSPLLAVPTPLAYLARISNSDVAKKLGDYQCTNQRARGIHDPSIPCIGDRSCCILLVCFVVQILFQAFIHRALKSPSDHLH